MRSPGAGLAPAQAVLTGLPPYTACIVEVSGITSVGLVGTGPHASTARNEISCGASLPPKRPETVASRAKGACDAKALAQRTCCDPGAHTLQHVAVAARLRNMREVRTLVRPTVGRVVCVLTAVMANVDASSHWPV